VLISPLDPRAATPLEQPSYTGQGGSSSQPPMLSGTCVTMRNKPSAFRLGFVYFFINSPFDIGWDGSICPQGTRRR